MTRGHGRRQKRHGKKREVYGRDSKKHRFTSNQVGGDNKKSGSFKRKLDTMEKEWRKGGFEISIDFSLKGKDLVTAKDEWLQTKGIANKAKATAPRQKSELKSAHEIAKDRDALDRRRAKTGRHAQFVGKAKRGKGRK